MSSTITADGQVTIPRGLLKQLDLSPGDDVALELQSDRKIVLTKAAPAPSADLASYRSRLESVIGTSDVGMTTDEIMTMLRGDVDDL